jgi:hypothetical protein
MGNKHNLDNMNWRHERDTRHMDRAAMETRQMEDNEIKTFIIYGWESRRFGEKPQHYGGLYVKFPSG